MQCSICFYYVTPWHFFLFIMFLISLSTILLSIKLWKTHRKVWEIICCPHVDNMHLYSFIVQWTQNKMLKLGVKICFLLPPGPPPPAATGVLAQRRGGKTSATPARQSMKGQRPLELIVLQRHRLSEWKASVIILKLRPCNGLQASVSRLKFKGHVCWRRPLVCKHRVVSNMTKKKARKSYGPDVHGKRRDEERLLLLRLLPVSP